MDVEEAKRRIIARQNGEKLAAPRLNIYQGERLVGSIPSWPPRSTSDLFVIRLGDFKLDVPDPKSANPHLAIAASAMIGPGDFDLLEGFLRPDGSQPERSTMAEDFDALRKAGLSRTEAIGETINKALRG